MKKNTNSIVMAALFAVSLLLNSSSAFAVSWTNWNTVQTGFNGSGSGVINFGSDNVNVTMNGIVGDFVDGNSYFVNYPSTYGNLAPSDLIREWYSGSVTLNFSKSVIDPYIALVSVGQSYGVNYGFQNLINPISVVSSGPNQWGNGTYSINGNTFIGREFNGILKLAGTYDSITFSINPNEYWHGFNVGASAPVPEPGTMVLLGFGMLGLAVYGKRRMNKET